MHRPGGADPHEVTAPQTGELGEGCAVRGPVPGDEMVPDLAWADPIDYWAVMTGGPIQPAGAIIGGLIGLGRHMRVSA